jgi:hypothetical protein
LMSTGAPERVEDTLQCRVEDAAPFFNNR